GDHGDAIKVVVYATDGNGGTSGNAENTVTVVNTLPTATTVSAMRQNTTSDQPRTATPSGFSDADGDTLTYHYQWSKNGAAITGATGSTLDLSVAGNGDRGDAIKVDVYATDGFGGMSGTINNTVTVVNSLPSITGGSASRQYSDPLSFTPTASDADGDILSF